MVKGFTPYEPRDGQIWALSIIAVLVGVGFWVLLNKTRFGFDLRASGQSQTAALASGVNPKRMIVIAMMLSGAVAGLVWLPALFGAAGSYGTSYQSQLGFTGIAVALLGRNRPLGMLFGAVLFAFLVGAVQHADVRHRRLAEHRADHAGRGRAGGRRGL